MAMNVLELARRILIASVNRETTGKYCTHLFLRRLLVFVFSGWGGVFGEDFERTWIIERRRVFISFPENGIGNLLEMEILIVSYKF